mmetsp:Transcript_22118/g.32967  ORF Transcript_22118/g.32967 Transcript_22118/m.32967 type:complete len:327 (+) Transcript_22118:230-1210(+)
MKDNSDPVLIIRTRRTRTASSKAKAILQSKLRPRKRKARSLEHQQSSETHASPATASQPTSAPSAPASSKSFRRSGTVKKPKRPKTAYNFFQLAIRKQLWEELAPQIKGPKDRVHCNEKIARVIGRRWKALTAVERSCYQVMADRDKQRYVNENDLYIARLHNHFAKAKMSEKKQESRSKVQVQEPVKRSEKKRNTMKLEVSSTTTASDNDSKDSVSRLRGEAESPDEGLCNGGRPPLLKGGKPLPKNLARLMSPPVIENQLFSDTLWELPEEPRIDVQFSFGNGVAGGVDGATGCETFEELTDIHDVLKEFKWHEATPAPPVAQC